MAQNTSDVDLDLQGLDNTIKIKTERQDDYGDNQKSSSGISNIIDNEQFSQLQSRNITITAVESATNVETSHGVQSRTCTSVSSKPAATESVPPKPEPPAIDFPSICGAFGWTTIGAVHLPFIIRGDDRFVAVRMVECKIISKYAEILPWSVFTCTNIKSYYITDNEAQLLNEINGFHCEFQFGYQTFSSKDVVVRLGDTVKFFEFLECCRTKLHPSSGNPIFSDQCGFVMLNCSAVPYVKKRGLKYIPMNMVYQDSSTAHLMETEKISEWDMAYLRFLCYVSSMDKRIMKVGDSMCSLQDLQQSLGLIHIEEWWPELQYSSEAFSPVLSNSNFSLPNWSDSLTSIHTDVLQDEKLRERANEVQENIFNPFLNINKLTDTLHPTSESPCASSSFLSSSSSTSNTQDHSGSHVFPSSLEGLLATPSDRDYNQSINCHSSYDTLLQSSLLPDRRHGESGLSALATSRPRPFPPPPPLVRLGMPPRTNSVPADRSAVSKPPPPLYPYLQSNVNTFCPPWLSHVLEPDWLFEDESRKVSMHHSSESASLPDKLSKRLSGEETWDAANLSSNINSSNYRNNSAVGRMLRDTYDQNYGSFYRDDRIITNHGSSPRPSNGPGAPPYYPTPPQSSPLQPLPVLDCSILPGLTDVFPPQTVSNFDLCSPPPSPDVKNNTSNSPRRANASVSYQPHVVRLVQVDSRYMLAINVEPHKHNSVLAVPISDVVTKFLKGTSVQSCQVILETVFGLHLYECTSLHQETYAKQNVAVIPGNKLVSVVDLRNYLYQLRFLLAEKEKEKNYEVQGTDAELPLSKRWCRDEQVI